MRYLEEDRNRRRRTDLPCPERAAGEVRRHHAGDPGGRLLGVDRAPRSSDPADETARRSGRQERPPKRRVGHRQRSPRWGHVGVHLSGGVAACRCHSIRCELSADVRYRPHGSAPPPAAAYPRPAHEARGDIVKDDSTSGFTRKGLATRARIVGAAARLMFERGVADTSIEEVRSAARVGGSQVSHYFRDKRDLTRQVIASRRAALISTPCTARADASTGPWPAN